MAIYERFPEIEEPRDLEDKELEIFAESTVWPAAEFFWGSGYRNPENLDDAEAVGSQIASPDGENKIELSVYLEAEYPLNDEDEVDDEGEPDLYVSISLETYRGDLTRIYKKSSNEDVEVWEVLCYDFDCDGTPPIANRYYTFRKDDEEIDYDEISRRQANFLKKISRLSKYDPDRSPDINTQDVIDIRNILLALEVPEGIIVPQGDKK